MMRTEIGNSIAVSQSADKHGEEIHDYDRSESSELCMPIYYIRNMSDLNIENIGSLI